MPDERTRYGRRAEFLRDLEANFQRFRATRELESEQDTPGTSPHSRSEINEETPLLNFEDVHMDIMRRRTCTVRGRDDGPATPTIGPVARNLKLDS